MGNTKECTPKANTFVENNQHIKKFGIDQATTKGMKSYENMNKKLQNDLKGVSQLVIKKNGSQKSQSTPSSSAEVFHQPVGYRGAPSQSFFNNTMPRINPGHCGVPQCNTYRTGKISMFRLPKEVRDSPFILRNWSRALHMRKQFPKQFFICELHFGKYQVLKPINGKRAFLVKGAFPTQNLPKSMVESNQFNKLRAKRLLARALSVARRRNTCDEEQTNSDDTTEDNATENVNESYHPAQDCEQNITIQEMSITKSHRQCGVPQCTTRRKVKGISMFRIPRHIRKSPALLLKLSKTLRMQKPFPKHFTICSLHFEKNQIIMPKQADKKSNPYLRHNAFPSLYLPKSENMNKETSKQLEDEKIRHLCEKEQTDPLSDDCTKTTQVNLNPSVVLSSFCDTDKKLNALTGLDDKLLLDDLVNESLKIRKEDNVFMAMRDRIILTMCKLKTNFDFEQLAVLFQINDTTTANYFADTIKHLAEIVRPSIYWPSKEENIKSLPQTFKKFPNVRTVMECIDINIHPQIKILIGVAPSGLINYVSNVFSGFISNKDMFLQTDLLQSLKPDDAVMIDNDFYIQDPLSNTRIKMLKLDIDQAQNQIAAAKGDIKRRIEKLKKFKVLSEEFDASLIPFINDIMIALCGLSNIYLNNN